MNMLNKRLALAILMMAVTVPVYAILGTLTSEKLTSSGKVCYYDVGNGVIKSITIGKSEMCPQTKNF